MGLHDRELEAKLLRSLDKLERQIDWVGPTPLRRSLNEQVVNMRQELRQFDQEKYENGEP